MKWIILMLLTVGTIGYVFFVGLQAWKKEALFSAGNIYYGFQQAKDSLWGLKPQEAQDHFAYIKDEIDFLRSKLPPLSDFIPLVKKLPPIFSDLTELTTAAAALTEQLDYLKKDGAQLVFEKKGDDLIKNLKAVNNEIELIDELASRLKQEALAVKFPLGEEIAGIDANLTNANIFLEALTGWLEMSRAHQILLMFQNSSEIRPGGGFLGSFGLLSLHKGSLVNLEINDVYDFDGQLDQKIVPPRPLQSLTIDWEARDANWFFDFPTSARKTMEFLERSKIYQERGVKFDGAIAVNVKVFRDILEIIGPIDILGSRTSNGSPTSDGNEVKMTLTADNFLAEIQREVETKQNKNILKEATPVILERLASLNEEQKLELVKRVSERIGNKDLMIYLHDVVLENLVQSLGVGGEAVNLPADYFGDYLAVVNANVAGGKTDAFIEQKIKLASRVTETGEIINRLTIERTHTGGQEADHWYNTVNKNYLQVLAPAGSELLSLEGGMDKKISPLVDYQKKKYKKDDELRALDEGKYLGRQIFDTWINTDPGETKKVLLEYKSPNNFFAARGDDFPPYYFIFEKQSGVDGLIEYSIEAPPGFIWQESGGPARIAEQSAAGGPFFIYKDEISQGRTVIKINLLKID